MLNKSLNIFAEKTHELHLHLVQTFLMHIICSEIIQGGNRKQLKPSVWLEDAHHQVWTCTLTY